MHELQNSQKKLGWSVKIKSMQEELFVCTCVGSFLNWENPLEDVSEYKFVLSKVLMSSDHQEEDLALKSSVIIDTVGLPVLVSLKSCSKFNKKWAKFTSGKLQSTIIFLLLSFISNRRFFGPGFSSISPWHCKRTNKYNKVNKNM